MKNKPRDWPTFYNNMLKPYGRLPFGIIDDKGRLFTRAKTKGCFEHILYDNRATGGGYHSTSMHVKHPELICAKYIWTKKELQQYLANPHIKE
jgi:hypothetical protein